MKVLDFGLWLFLVVVDVVRGVVGLLAMLLSVVVGRFVVVDFLVVVDTVVEEDSRTEVRPGDSKIFLLF